NALSVNAIVALFGFPCMLAHHVVSASNLHRMTMRVSKRFLDRARGNLRKYQKAFEGARSRDVGESDTCVIISDFLADVLGYDKYNELTTEFAIRSTFCDLAIKVDGRLQYLIEV